MKNFLRRFSKRYNIRFLISNPFLWLYSAYISVRYVDESKNFPAIKFNNFVKVKFTKHKTARLIINTNLIFEGWLKDRSRTNIIMNENSTLLVKNEFGIGNGMKILVNQNSLLQINGKLNQSASGVTADSVIMVNKQLIIGYDCLIAWNTFITDCDWHTIENSYHTEPTTINDSVWIGVGAKVLKGVTIGERSIITSNSVVIKGDYPAQALLSGNPAKVVKTPVPDWNRDMI